MKLIEITDQHRNDFRGILQCEHCGATRKLTSGYDDAYYHEHVIPGFHCTECGKNRAGDLERKVEADAS